MGLASLGPGLPTSYSVLFELQKLGATTLVCLTLIAKWHELLALCGTTGGRSFREGDMSIRGIPLLFSFWTFYRPRVSNSADNSCHLAIVTPYAKKLNFKARLRALAIYAKIAYTISIVA